MEVFVINQYLVNQRLLDIFMVIFGLFGQNIHMLCKKIQWKWLILIFILLWVFEFEELLCLE